MKKLLIISLLMFSISMSAQQLISTTAKSVQGVSWTIGEMVTETIVGDGICAIQGFNHPLGLVPSFVGIESIESPLTFIVYPNPVVNELTLNYGTKGVYSWRLTNLLGQEVLAGQSCVISTSVDVTGLASGNYLLTVASDQEIKSIIIIKK